MRLCSDDCPIFFREVTEPGPSHDDESGGSLSRHVHRVREISLMNIVRGNAQERMKLAMDSRTRPAIQLTDLKEGQQVDIYRDPPNKDVSGWRGPSKIVSLDRADEGIVEVRWQGRVIPC